MRIFVCAIACVCAWLATTRTASAQGAEAGVRTGLTSATLSVTNFPGFSPNAGIGFLIGGWVSSGSDVLRIQPELLFTTRHISSSTLGVDVKVDTRTIDVPVLLVARPRTGQRVRPVFYGGPFFSHLIDPTQTIDGVESGLDALVTTTDAGVTFGGGTEIGAGSHAVVIDARFAIGLRDLSKQAGTTIKSRTFMLSFGFRF